MKKNDLYSPVLAFCVSWFVACDQNDAVTPLKVKEGPLLTRITTADGLQTQFTYDAQNRLAEIRRYNGQDKPETAETFTYDGQGNLTRSDVKSNSLGVPTQRYTTYEYDKENRVRVSRNYFRLHHQDFEHRSFVTYAYNETNQLVQKNTYDPDSSLRQYQTFVYDSRRNVIESTNYSYHVVPAGSSAVRTSTVAYTVDHQKNPYYTPELPALLPDYSNSNNVVQTVYTYFNELNPGREGTSHEVSYQYNEQGYPVQMMENGVVYQLEYTTIE